MEWSSRYLSDGSIFPQFTSSDSDSNCGDRACNRQVDAKAYRKANGEERMPTRRPNPDVYNRNALLARENRRKKKAYVEAVEKELNETRNANKQLKKVMKHQLKTIQTLERDKRYFQSIIANYKEIQCLIKTLNCRLQPAAISHETKPEEGHSCTEVRFSTKVSLESENDLGETKFEPSAHNDKSNSNGVPISLCNGFENFSSDFPYSSVFKESWSNLLGDDLGPQQDCTDVSSVQPLIDTGMYHLKDNVNPEPSSENPNGNDPGLCLHISQGRVSLEFCPNCDWNSSKIVSPSILNSDC